MYKNGELEQVMKSFERTLEIAPIYVGAWADRAEKVEVEILSSIDGYGWICKGEWSTEQEAQEDRKNWF